MSRSRWFSLPAFALATLVACALWWWQGRAADVVDAQTAKVPCLSYAPYRDGQSPFDPNLVIPPAQIEEDLRALASHTSCIRTYATEQGLTEVPRIAQAIGLRVLLGAWIGSNPANNQHELTKAIDLANRYPETIEAVIVGNEVLLRREQPAERLAALIDQTRAAVPVPVTYADVWEFWVQNQELADHVDFVTIHTLPYWEDEPIAVGQAINHVIETWRHMRDLFSGKPVMIGEAGWPSAGRMREGALPSLLNQARFVRGLLVAAKRDGFRINFIEAFDQPWKRELEGTVGAYWGFFSSDRKAKFELSGPVARDPWWFCKLIIASTLTGIAILIAALRQRFTPFAWLTLACASQAVAGSWLLAVSDLMVVSGSAVDWIVGVIQLCTAAALPLLIFAHTLRAKDAQRRPQAVPAEAILEILRTRRWTKSPPFTLMFGITRLVLLVGAAATTLALAFDPRYRDFPIALYAAPSILLVSVAWLDWRARDTRTLVDRPNGREEHLLGWLLLAGGLAVLAREGFENIQAMAWTGITVCLGASALINGAGSAQAVPRLQPDGAQCSQDQSDRRSPGGIENKAR
ncbi:MAG: hypothetical protein H6905_00545 [Hyphomicrobiales bacterium]|nr:hypothetical protein [Hyphomicrobiales bacterium]